MASNFNQKSAGSVQSPERQSGCVGIIAGNGSLPIVIANAIHAEQPHTKVVAAMHLSEADPTLASRVDKATWVRVGQFGKIIRFFKSQQVREVVFVGGIKRPTLIGGFLPDLVGIRIITNAGGFSDDRVLRSAVAELERNGMVVRGAHELVPKLLAAPGYRCGAEFSSELEADVNLGWQAAQRLGELDIGQTVVVHKGVVIAVEGTEGTDACIRRAGTLAGAGCVVVKRAKPQQDTRVDLPTIGPDTVAILEEIKAAALVVHAGHTLIVDPQRLEATARRAHIAVLARS